MKIRYTFVVCCLLMMAVMLRAQTGSFETAFEAVEHMKVGWNLGNTLDAHQIGVSDVTASETLRGQPVTTPALMEMMKMAGFNAIRIPITWYPHMDNNGTIDAAWMNRVQEVVDYVINQDMYCIINIHHDTGKTGNSNQNKAWLRATMHNYNTNKTVFENIWRQIATRFKNYDQRLIFEGFNEMLDTLDSWRYPSWKAPGEYDAQIAESGYNAINSYNRSFVQTVRATGGNNAYRNLIISPYAACDARIPGGHNPDPFERLAMPENSNHIIIGIHSYPSIADKPSQGGALRPVADYMAEVENTMMFAEQYFIQRYNAPVIIGEWGTLNVDENPNDYSAHRTEMFEFVDYFVNKAKEHRMATFFWMGLSNQAARALPYFNQADLAARILKAYHGSDYKPMILTQNDYESTVYDVTFNKQWAEIFLVQSSTDLKTNYKGIEVELASAPNVSGNLSFRAYPNANNDEGYQNGSNLTSTTNTLYFSSVSNINTIKRLTIIWRSTPGNPNIKIKAVRLIRTNGTKESKTPTNRTGCTVNVINKPKFITSKVGSTKYASLYYGNENLIVPPYATAKAYKIENGNLSVVKTYEEGNIIPKGTGVILQTTEGTVYKFALSSSTGQPATGSMMRGSDTEQMTTGGDKYYKLSLNGNLDENSVGFYFGKAGGAAFMNGAHKAYLAVPAEQAMSTNYLFNHTNGINTIDNRPLTKDQNAWYTLDGRHLNGKPSQKGIYIHQGRKVVIK